MAGGWRGSTRKATLPRDWSKIRAQRLAIDGFRCTHTRVDTGRRCVERATDVDHVGDRADHRLSQLRSKCSWHHLEKSSREGGDAATKWAAIRAREQRAARKHPGLR
ncbi:hypothetical protein [Brachybacterium kimchii]|uniref:HNH endonuclease n=1 Tax=Brachybacterium kimchii TaxID=2942909 RepID=A0ABY4NB59_9MICO|nr:hypothetical protein [Brachybacterium kimchii]UQN30668.1 hypothetical protein M4486_05025 [Brachybacterium kimchii]